MLFICFCSCTTDQNKVFKLLDSEYTGIDFNNVIQETDTFNMYTFMNIYTGGGVAVGDINNDGLQDVFFSGNRVSSRLYLNKGNMRFEDISISAGISTSGWCSGVSIIDINQDGFTDIYVNVSGIKNTANLLFVNNGDNTFSELAKEYGIAIDKQTMHSGFLDYDLDGDLDLFTIVNPVDYTMANINRIKERSLKGESGSVDLLFRNNGNNTFTDVSEEAGILIEGYSLGLATSDVNMDGWPDIYISNDFLTNDILYINNGDGTFTDRASEYLNHTSFAGMGNDVSDVNNDGLPDIMVADMLPEDNYRRKMIIPASSYDKFQLSLDMGYNPQYTRNTLQINNGQGKFSEIGQMCGIDKTDWSWSTLFADYDNDGDRDLFVTNGFGRDVGNLDYINYQRKSSTPFGKRKEVLKQKVAAIGKLAPVKIPDYLYESTGDYAFKKRSQDWGIEKPSCSNGASFADLDNDGDLDLLVNVVNEKAFVYENNTSSLFKNNYLRVELKGSPNNRQGIGAKLYAYSGDHVQYIENSPYRGYESSVDPVLHLGFGATPKIDSIKVIWPDGKGEVLEGVFVNQLLTLKYTDAKALDSTGQDKSKGLFVDVTQTKGIIYTHKENEFIDFKIQPLLPHKHSQNGPGIAVGDVNGDGLDDVYVGGAKGFSGKLFIQLESGTFSEKPIDTDAPYEDMGCLFFDADGDGNNDLYIVSGGTAFEAGSEMYQDRLYMNDGAGQFMKLVDGLPRMTASGASIKAADYDRDGDLDLFVGGRIVPGAYPLPAKSYLLRNDSKPTVPKFTDVTTSALPELADFGLLTDALWTDYNNDGLLDLIVVGEWTPITFFKNTSNGFVNDTDNTGLLNTEGWWNSLSAGDFDADGDIDYVVGNLGINSRHKASADQPLCVYGKDFDNNGRIDPVMCYFIQGENQIAHPRNSLIDQMSGMRGRFKTHESYASANFNRSFMEEELKGALVVKSKTFQTSFIENLGNGKFNISSLPVDAQVSPVFGILTEDINADGKLDIVMVGNSYATEVSLGRYDAFKGLMLLGNGEGGFESAGHGKEGFRVDSDAKGLAKLITGENELLMLSTSNADTLSVFQSTVNSLGRDYLKVKQDDVRAEILSNDDKLTKIEFYFGSTYLSQSSRVLKIPKDAKRVSIYNSKGEVREISINDSI